METEDRWESERLPSGIFVVRRFRPTGELVHEQFTFGAVEIGLQRDIEKDGTFSESYFSNSRMVSRRTYEARRLAYPDMPAASTETTDSGAALMRLVRQEQKRNRENRARRLAESAESRFPRPAGTNWLRVITPTKAHLVEFASRDWKFLSSEREVRAGREWLDAFGFCPQSDGFGIAEGLQVGYEITSKTAIVLDASHSLLIDISRFAEKPPEFIPWTDSFRPRRERTKPNPAKPWLELLPPLIQFLSELNEPTVTIFNHHQ